MGGDRGAAVDTHQLRAGHWSASEQWLHRIGRSPFAGCTGCADLRCPAALCRVCREEADTPRHVLLRCPSLCGPSAGYFYRILGSIHAQAPDMSQDDVVASLASGFRALRSRLAKPPHEAWSGGTMTTTASRLAHSLWNDASTW